MPARIVRRLINCIRPYDGFKNRKLIKSYSGFQKEFYRNFWAQAAKEIGADIVDVGYGFTKIQLNDAKTYVVDYRVMLDNHVTLKIAANKPLVLKLLQNDDFYVPQFLEYKLNTFDSAATFLETLGVDMVVKPANGTGAGKGVTTHIDSLKKLKKASKLASIYGDSLLMEEQIKGDSYRLLYIGGKFVDCIRRDPPVVIGDGISNIKTLIKHENDRRISSKGALTFHPLIIDMDCKLNLKEQGLSIKSIPEKNQPIAVKSVVNQNNYFQNHVVRDEVHKDVIAIGKKLMDDLGIELGGIDIITSDISVSLQESKGVINEINTTPGLHHHILVEEKDKILPIGEMVLKYIFKH